MGVIANNVIVELTKAGFDVQYKFLNTDQDWSLYPPEVQKAVTQQFDPNECTEIMFTYPDIYPAHMNGKIRVGYTGADSSGWYATSNVRRPGESCNEFCHYMLTPSDYSRKIMLSNGVNIPVELFPHGVNLDLFKPFKRERNTPLTFLFLGELTIRKGAQDLIRGFIDAFGKNNPAFKLVMRANNHMQYLQSDEIIKLAQESNNIFVTWENKGQEDVVNYMNNANVFCWMSRADWFGMPPFEALATGMPTIATATNGYWEFLSHMIYPITTVPSPVHDHPYLLGNWNEPNPNSIRQSLVDTANNYERIAEESYKHAFEIREKFSWKKVTEDYLIPFLDKVYQKHFKPETKGTKMSKRLTVGIPTKDRGIELAILLQSLMYQTFQDWDLIIVNDCVSNLLYENSTLQGLFKVLGDQGHDVKIINGPRKGPQYGGQIILQNSQTELILRLDDDVALQPNFIEELVRTFDDPNTGMAGPIYLNPQKPARDQMLDPNMSLEAIKEIGKVKWEGNNLFLTGWNQAGIHPTKTPVETEHLNSGFMYRREAGLKIGGYFLDLSIAGHREESDFSYRIFREGYKLYVVPAAIAYHYHPMFGGIRETAGQFHAKSNWDSDEKKFLERMEKWLPKSTQFKDDIFVSVITLTYGMHAELRALLDGIAIYTNHPCELIWVNNDNSPESYLDLLKVKEEFESRSTIPVKLVNMGTEKSVSEGRNIGTLHMDPKSKFICFIDDDARILGRYNQTTDWIDYLYNRFHEELDVGAVSPIYTYYEPLQTRCISVACMFTSLKVWNKVGRFDPVFGNKKKGTWGYEDTDWSYRCLSTGFKLLGVKGGEFPFWHADTTGKPKPQWKEEGLLKAEKLLLEKHNHRKVNEVCRTIYPFTKEQMEIKGTKLNVGCYYLQLDDFINIDIQPTCNPDVILDMRNIKSLYQDNTISLILISQCLEHINEEEVPKLLRDFYEILRPGGQLIVEVPDCENLEEKLASGKIGQHDYNVLKEGHKEVDFQGHWATFDKDKLGKLLYEAGFGNNLTLMPPEMTSDHYLSLRIDARK